jgi:hypothetical protein
MHKQVMLLHNLRYGPPDHSAHRYSDETSVHSLLRCASRVASYALCLNPDCPCSCTLQVGPAGASSISAGFTALCSSYQQLAGTGTGIDVLDGSSSPVQSAQVHTTVLKSRMCDCQHAQHTYV